MGFRSSLAYFTKENNQHLTKLWLIFVVKQATYDLHREEALFFKYLYGFHSIVLNMGQYRIFLLW